MKVKDASLAKTRLPEEFVKKMQNLLAHEWDELLKSWQGVPYQGLRVNNLKISVEDFLHKEIFSLKEIPWAKNGFYYDYGIRPAKHPYYQAGLYYLQEPSAMSPAACLDVKPGEKVLDLCAAPGGKSTQLATMLQGKGLLVSNDLSKDRVKALVWNLEHWGVVNAVVTNEEPVKLSAYFSNFFDKILVDAPCSGEGMFRKDTKAAKSWTGYNNNMCSALQKEILNTAAKMLKPGGKLLYSTCTFSPEEDEKVVVEFLDNNVEFSLCSLPNYPGWDTGRAEWVNSEYFRAQEVVKTRRLWPHKIKGEGHFLALFEKNNEGDIDKSFDANWVEDKKIEPLAVFMEDNLTKLLEGKFIQQGNYVYKIPTGMPSLQGLRVVRPGWFLGVLKNKRFEPSQALAMGLKIKDVKRSVQFSLQDEDVKRYLKGETLLVDGPKGWTLVCLEHFPLGWAKQTGDNLKNYYPRGWRLLD